MPAAWVAGGSALLGAYESEQNRSASSAAANAAGSAASAWGSFQSARELQQASKDAAAVQVGAATKQGDTLANAAQQSANQISQGAATAGQLEAQGIQGAINTSSNVLAQQAASSQPYIDAGNSALTTLSAGLNPGGEFNRQFTMADATNSSAEQFALQQGLQAEENVAAMGGQVQGTNLQQQATKFAAGTAAQYQNQAFQQWLQSTGMSLSALQNAVKTGQISSEDLQKAQAQYGVNTETLQQNLGQAQGTTATNIANAQAAGTQGVANARSQEAINIGNDQSAGIMGKGNAQAAGTVGVTNALGAGLSSVGNAMSLANAASASNLATGNSYMNNLNNAANAVPTSDQVAQYGSDLSASGGAMPTGDVSNVATTGAGTAPVDTSNIPTFDLASS